MGDGGVIRLVEGEGLARIARGAVEVELLNDDMWLEGRDDDALAAGANLAMIGDELCSSGAWTPWDRGCSACHGSCAGGAEASGHRPAMSTANASP